MARRKRSRTRPKTESLTGLAGYWKQYRDHHNAAEAVHLALREAILRGALPAGEPLGEVPLAEAFGRSRTPVREAVLKLESEGLAERLPRRGLVVARITREEVLEVYAVREVLDGLSARLAAAGILPSELDHLVWLNERLRAAVEAANLQALIGLNIEFHEAICRAGRNSLLLEFMRRIHEWVRRFQDTTMSVQGRGLEAVAEHESLIEAIRRRDPEEAERLARSHMSHARQIRVSMIQASAAAQAAHSGEARNLDLAAPVGY